MLPMRSFWYFWIFRTILSKEVPIWGHLSFFLGQYEQNRKVVAEYGINSERVGRKFQKYQNDRISDHNNNKILYFDDLTHKGTQIWE